MIEKVKEFLFPNVDSEVQRYFDMECVGNMRRMSFVVMIFELASLVLFVFTRKEFDRSALISIASVTFCTVFCLIGFLFSSRMLKSEHYSHLLVLCMEVTYFLVLSFWSIHVSYRHYFVNEQFLTFFAVQLMAICFVPLRPFLSILLVPFVYGVLYLILYLVDGATGIHEMNYMVLILVSIAGMIVRYSSQLEMSRNSVLLKKNNELLEYANRHDALTGLLNRQALLDDVEKLVDHEVTAHMIDINYFKEINDGFGHAKGDAVLKETAKRIGELFPESLCYRYGGDEFLVLSADIETYNEETIVFMSNAIPGKSILLSVGRAMDKILGYDELFNLISSADASLYEVKKKTHSVEYGGHDRRRSR